MKVVCRVPWASLRGNNPGGETSRLAKMGSCYWLSLKGDEESGLGFGAGDPGPSHFLPALPLRNTSRS
jgi:hypothetical protein